MKKKDLEEEYIGKWLLRDKKDNIIYFSSSLANVVEEGRKYPFNEITIDQKLLEGTCFF